MKHLINPKNTFLLTVGVVLAFSCVPRKKVVYLQDNQTKEENIAADIKKYKDDTHFVTEYKIRKGDNLMIRVFALNHDEFNFLDRNAIGGNNNRNNRNQGGILGYVVDDSGYVEIPVIGDIYILDQTIEEAEETIKKVLEEYIISPSVVIQSLSYDFTLLGEVKRAGTYSSFDRRINIFEAIAMGNDLTEFADRSKVKILRYNNAGQVEVYYVNLLSQDIFDSEVFQVMPNDMIMVPPMASKNFRRNIIPITGFVLSTFGAVYVLLTRFKII